MARIVEAEIPRLFDNYLLTKKRSFLTQAGLDVSLVAYILDENGEPRVLDSNDYDFRARIVEAIDKKPTNEIKSLSMGSDGKILVNLPSSVTKVPAIYDLSVAAINKNTNQIEYVTDYFIYLEPSIWIDEDKRSKGPPPFQRLKTRLRDSSILENELTQNYQFQLTDICEAAITAIEEYNCTPPRILSLHENTATFGDHDTYMDGIEAFLFRNIIEHYRKNSLQYVAAGLQINDNKLNEYTQAYMEAMKRYSERIIQMKAAANYAMGWGMTKGLYSRRIW